MKFTDIKPGRFYAGTLYGNITGRAGSLYKLEVVRKHKTYGGARNQITVVSHGQWSRAKNVFVAAETTNRYERTVTPRMIDQSWDSYEAERTAKAREYEARQQKIEAQKVEAKSELQMVQDTFKEFFGVELWQDWTIRNATATQEDIWTSRPALVEAAKKLREMGREGLVELALDSLDI